MKRGTDVKKRLCGLLTALCMALSAAVPARAGYWDWDNWWEDWDSWWEDWEDWEVWNDEDDGGWNDDWDDWLEDWDRDENSGTQWTLTGRELSISGQGGVSGSGWEGFSGTVTALRVSEGVTKLPGWAFWDFTALKSVSLPSTLSALPMGIFSGCTALERIDLPEGVSRIGDWAFEGCTALTRMTLPGTLVDIETDAFENCKALTDVYYPGTAAAWSLFGLGDAFSELDVEIHFGTADGPEEPDEPNEPDQPDEPDKPAPSGRRPSLNALTYRFSNSYEGLNYTPRYRIPLERFQYVFGNTTLASYFYQFDGEWGGSCYGLSSTSGMFFQDGNGVSASDFRTGAEVPADLSLGDRNSGWNLTLREFTEAMQISQFADVIQEDYRSTSDDLAGLVQAVEHFETTGTDPVLVAVSGPEGGHALLGYAVEETGGTGARLMVYDSNYPETERYVTLTRNSAGTWTGWYYPLNDTYNWGSAYRGCDISYVPYEHFYSVWNSRGAARNSRELLTVSADADVYDVEGNLVVSLRDGEAVTDRSDVFPLRLYGMTADGQSRGTATGAVWLPADLYTVKRTGAALQSDDGTAAFHASMTHLDQSASIATAASAVTFAVDDRNSMNFVSLDPSEQGKPYDITLYSTLADTYGEVRLTGVVQEEKTTFAQIAGSLFVNGTSPAARGALYINGEAVDLNGGPDRAESPCTIQAVSVDSDSVTVRIENRSASGASVWAAAYAADGRMLSAGTAALPPFRTESVTVPLSMENAAFVKVMVLDGTLRPLCASARKKLS